MAVFVGLDVHRAQTTFDAKNSRGRRGMPLAWRVSKNSSGRPAAPVAASVAHSSVEPLRGVAHTT